MIIKNSLKRFTNFAKEKVIVNEFCNKDNGFLIEEDAIIDFIFKYSLSLFYKHVMMWVSYISYLWQLLLQFFVLNGIIFDIKIVVEVDLLPLFLCVEKRRDFLPFFINLMQFMHILLYLSFNRAQINCFLYEMFPDRGILFAIKGDILHDIVVLDISIEDIKKFSSSTEYSFVKIGWHLFNLNLYFANLDFLQ